MDPDFLARKRRYHDAIFQHVNENPQKFRDPERPAQQAAAPRVVAPRAIGRVGPRPAPTEAERAFNAGLYDGFTFGLGDELEAGWASLGAMFDDRDMDDLYESEVALARAEAQQLERDHPFAFGGGAIVGSLINPVTYAPGGWLVHGARAAGQAGRVANLAKTATKLAAIGGIEGGVHGFNSGEGGLRNRLARAGDEAFTGALAGALVPVGARVAVDGGKLVVAGGKAAVAGLGRAAEATLDVPTRRVIGRITAMPAEALALLERAQLMRRREVNHPDLDLPEMASTAYDLAFKKGTRLADEMQILQQGLHGQGFDTAKAALTRPRMDRVGMAYVGPGYSASPSGFRLKSLDRQRRYRRPSDKEEVYGTGMPGVQANLERQRINSKKYRHNLHINIIDTPPRAKP